jgi:hypothetical protein
MTSRKHPSAAFWATVVVVCLLVAYPLSFGVWFWFVSRTGTLRPAIPVVYRPVMLFAGTGPTARTAIQRYANLFASGDWAVIKNRSRGFELARIAPRSPSGSP